MFQGNNFDLQKFKAMMDSDEDLKRFQAILKQQREKILATQQPAFQMTELNEQNKDLDSKLLQETANNKPDEQAALDFEK